MQHLQRTRGRELLTRYGAHALSIEWDPTAGGQHAEPVLVLHVDPATPDRGHQPVPTTIEVVTEQGRTLQVPVRVQPDPPAVSE